MQREREREIGARCECFLDLFLFWGGKWKYSINSVPERKNMRVFLGTSHVNVAFSQ